MDHRRHRRRCCRCGLRSEITNERRQYKTSKRGDTIAKETSTDLTTSTASFSVNLPCEVSRSKSSPPTASSKTR